MTSETSLRLYGQNNRTHRGAEVQYLLAVHHLEDRPLPPEEEMQAAFARVGAFNEELTEAGLLVFAGGLQPSSTAKTLRVQGDDVEVTDGAHESPGVPLGGFWVIEAPSEDDAIAWAKKGTLACRETVVVRPFQQG